MKLSVCITHYNRPHRLAATLESLERQTRTPDEVLLWDDCSPNDPTEVATAFRGRFPRFVYQRNPRNLGMPGNLNAVIRQATGDLVANLHDADTFHPALLEKWEQALLRFPRAGLAFCGLQSEDDQGRPGRLFLEPLPEYSKGHDFFRRVFVGAASSLIWGTVMVRREVYDRHLPFDPQFRNWADVDMWMRVCATHGIAYVREPLILLDNTHVPHRAFSWSRFLICHRMHFVNVHRMAADRAELCRYLAAQRRCTRYRFVRHLASRLVRGKFGDFGRGIARTSDVLFRIEASDYRLSSDPEPRFVRIS